MALARKPTHPMQPEPRPENLDIYENCWVALKNGEIVAAAPTSQELACEIRRLGSKASGCTMQFVRPSADAYIVGVG